MSHIVTQQVLQRLEIMPEMLQQQVLEFVERLYVEQQVADKQMFAEVKAFRRLHAELWANYPYQYVAIYQGRLIDHDPAKWPLWERLEQNYRHETVLMRQVTPEIERVYRIRSPRLIRYDKNL